MDLMKIEYNRATTNCKWILQKKPSSHRVQAYQWRDEGSNSLNAHVAYIRGSSIGVIT